MSSRVLTLLIALLLVPSTQAQAPVKPRTDSLGDPLPEGAIARIGTLRFKHNPAQASTVDVALFAPDGSKIVSLSQNRDSIRLWDAASGKEIPGPWTTPNKRYSAVAFSPDSATLAVAANMEFSDKGQALRREITLYDIARAQAVKVISIKHHARALAFADGGKTVISAGEGTVCWWDLDSGKEKRSWAVFADDPEAKQFGQVKTFLSCVFAPNAQSLAVEVAWRRTWEFSANYNVQEAVGFNLRTGKVTWRATGVGRASVQYRGGSFAAYTSRLAFSADGKRVAWPVGPETVEVRDAVTGKLVGDPIKAKGLAGNELGLALSRDGSQMALAGADDNIILCKLTSPGAPSMSAPRKFMTRPVENSPYRRYLHFSPDDTRLLVAADADIQVYDFARLQEVQPWEGHRTQIGYVMLAADGKRLLTGSAKYSRHPHELASWDVATWKRLRVTSLVEPPWPARAVVSPNQSVYTDESGTELFDLASGKLLARLDVPKPGPRSPWRGLFSPSGKHYLFAGERINGKLSEHLFAVPSGKLLCELPVGIQDRASFTFSADERLVAIFGYDMMIHVCDTATGQERQRITGLVSSGGWQTNLALSPDSKYLACWLLQPSLVGVDPQPRIHLWDVATGKELLRIVTDSSSNPGALAWSPDSRVLAMGQHKIQLWEMATLGVRRELPGHGDATIQALALAFSRDSRLLASGSTDTTVLIWDPSMPGSGAAAAALARGDLKKRWQALAQDDAAKAYAAISELAAAPRETVAWIKEELKPAEPVDPKRMAELVGQLDHEQFKVRQKATAELLPIGERLVPALDKALACNPALEASLRLQDLRKRLTSLAIKGERLQAFRAVEVLEHIGTPEARQLLQKLAGGAPGALVTTQAQGALARLQK